MKRYAFPKTPTALLKPRVKRVVPVASVSSPPRASARRKLSSLFPIIENLSSLANNQYIDIEPSKQPTINHRLPLVPIISGLALVVILAAGFLGWRFYSSAHPSNSNPTEAANTTNRTLSDTYHSDITGQLKLTTIAMTGRGSQGIAIDPQTGYVYVGAFGGLNNACMQGNNQGASYLDVVDPSQDKQVTATVADFAPIWPAVDNSRGNVYLASSSGAVGIFKLGTGKRVGVYQVGGVPHQPAILGNILVASNTYNASQTYYTAVDLDTGKIIGNFQGPRLPHPVIVDPEKKIAYMMGVESGDVQIIDMTTGKPQSSFNLQGGAGQMNISQKYSEIITDANTAGNSAAFYDLNSHQKLGDVGFRGLGTPGTGLEVDDADGLLFVIMGDKNALAIASLKTMKPLGYFKVGPCPYAVRVDEQRSLGFVTNTGDGSLTKFDLKQLTAIFSR